MKEYLSAREVAYQSIDIVASADGLAQLHELGARNVPVVARGELHVSGLNLREVDAFLGLDVEAATILPSGELVQRLDGVLSAAQRYLRQLPDDQMAQQLPGRPRSYRELTHHIFQITRAFLAVTRGGELTYESLVEAPGDTLVSFADIADNGGTARRELLAWWEKTGVDADFDAAVATYYGPQSLHEALERTTWHTAQHVRQLLFVLEGLNITADGPLTESELAGLPLPQEVWDG